MSTAPQSPERPPQVEEELLIHERVKAAVRQKALEKMPDMSELARGLVELRDEAAIAHERDLPSLLDQLHLHHQLASRSYKTTLPDMRSPYFAHMRLKEKGRERDILVGHQTFIDTQHDVTIIDWKNAPLARIFFQYREGDSYYEELPGRVAEGTITMRRLLGFDKGQLVRIDDPGRGESFVLGDTGSWIAESAAASASLTGGAGLAERGERLGVGLRGGATLDVAGLLDPQQYRLLTAADEVPLLILGGAGSGKTTVAVHRLASLHSLNPGVYRPQSMLFLVPDVGLSLLIKRLLSRLRLEGVDVSSYDEWVSRIGRKVLRSLPSRVYEATPGRVVRFKRHPALLEAIPVLRRKRIEAFATQIDHQLSFVPEVGDLMRRDQGRTLIETLVMCEREATSLLASAGEPDLLKERQTQIRKTFASLEKQLFNLDTDRRALYGDRELLADVASRSQGHLTEAMVEEVWRHSRVQLAEAAKIDLGRIDQESLTMVDGRSLAEEGEDDHLEGSIDAEDLTLMFLTLLAYTGDTLTPEGRLPKYSHVTLDEAQELATSEIRLVGAALSDPNAVTIAGDAAQQTDPTSTFITWEHLLDQLGTQHVAAEHLMTNYRSPRPVAEFAHHVLGPLAPADMPKSIREGAPVMRSHYPDVGHAVLVMREMLEDLRLREPRASVAVLTSDSETARQFHSYIDEVPGCRLVLDGQFTFEPGIDVTEVNAVKGLEFDYVVIPDATIQNYPDLPEARRLMHVAATRAMHQLWVFSVGKPSPIIS